jgi:penicillin-binding protein 2
VDQQPPRAADQQGDRRVYAPGSTFKMAVALAGLEARAITPYDRINCPGYLDLGDTRFHCWSKGGHGSLDLHGG